MSNVIDLIKRKRSSEAHISVGEVVDLEHVDGMPHLGPFLRVGIHAPQRHQERLLQGLGGRLLRQFRIQNGLVVPVAHHLLQPLHEINLKRDAPSEAKVELILHDRPKQTLAELANNLRGRPGVIDRASAGDDLHDEDAEAVHVAPLVEHAGARVLRRHVTAKSRGIQFKFRHNSHFAMYHNDGYSSGGEKKKKGGTQMSP